MTSISTENKSKVPLVSVIITTKNEEKNIVNCLQSIKKQAFKNIEVILVDNFSKDNTVKLGKNYTSLIYLKGNERSTQRNYGVQIAQGKYVFYLDADMILSRNLIAECVNICENNLADALYVPERIIGTGFWIKVRDFERSFYSGTIIDAVRFIPRELFLHVGGFDESLIGPEDWDFDRKIRAIARTSAVLSPLYHNEGQFRIKRYLKKKEYYTDGIQNYIEKWGIKDPETLRQVGISYRIFGVFVENGKWKRLLRHPVQATAMYCLRLLVAIKYIQTPKKH